MSSQESLITQKMLSRPTLEDLQKNENNEAEIEVWVQIQAIKENQTKNGKPYFDLEIADGSSRKTLKIWSDSSAFEFLQSAENSSTVALKGKFSVNDYGLNVAQPSLRFLTLEECENLFAGSNETKQKSAADWAFFRETFENLAEPRLRAVTVLALNRYEKRWHRAAAARSHHHARRGGLLEHTSQMLRCAKALAPLYPEVTPDLLFAGVLFHDIGKLWENDYEESGFTAPISRLGEMVGHISLGVEIVNSLWRECREQQPELFADSEIVREHLLHLIVSHHGLREYGSPITPRTPEAWILHHIDNIDAKIEMLRCAYVEKEELAPGVFDVRRPLEGYAIAPLSTVLNKSAE